MAPKPRKSKTPKPRKSKRKSKPKVPAEAELKPFKIVGQLIGSRQNEHGDIIGEEVMGEVVIYRSNFSKVEKLVDDAVKEARAVDAARRKAEA